MFAKPDQFPFDIPAKFMRLIKKSFNTRAQWQVFKTIRKKIWNRIRQPDQVLAPRRKNKLRVKQLILVP